MAHPWRVYDPACHDSRSQRSDGGRPCSSIRRISFSFRFSPSRRLAPSQTPAPTPTPATPKYPDYPSEIPATFTPTIDGFDYVRRTAEIPMRDGVKLHTVILVPKGAKSAPMLLTRTPYDADSLTKRNESAHLGMALDGYDNPVETVVEGGYIRVAQDVRGKHGSEGDYVMNRPLHGPQNPTPVDHATDTWDTIDWLVKNVPESNGKVGILGISYDGFTPLMALVNPHPALKCSVPMNPDGGRLARRRLVPQRRVPADRRAVVPLRPGSVAQERREVVVLALRRLRGVPRGGLGGRDGPPPRPRAGRDVAEDPRAPDVRRVLAGPGPGPDPRRAAAEGARADRPQPLRPGGHLRRTRRLQGDRAEGREERHGLPRARAVAPRPGDPRGQRAGRREVGLGHGALVPAERPRLRSSTSTSRTAPRSPGSRR